MIKPALQIVVALFAALVAALVYVSLLTPQAWVGNKNRRNSCRIESGMSLQQVDGIMGKPESVASDNPDSSFIYYYTPPVGASSAVTVFFRPDSTVSYLVNLD